MRKQAVKPPAFKTAGQTIVLMLRLTLVAGILLFSACARRPPSEGMTDMQLAAQGIGEELVSLNDIPAGSTILVFGTPGAAGYGGDLEQGFISVLEESTQSKNLKIKQVTYTEDEIQIYENLQLEGLHQDFALAALERERQGANVAVSLLGWPNGNQNFIPNDLSYIALVWQKSSIPRSMRNRDAITCAVYLNQEKMTESEQNTFATTFDWIKETP